MSGDLRPGLARAIGSGGGLVDRHAVQRPEGGVDFAEASFDGELADAHPGCGDLGGLFLRLTGKALRD